MHVHVLRSFWSLCTCTLSRFLEILLPKFDVKYKKKNNLSFQVFDGTVHRMTYQAACYALSCRLAENTPMPTAKPEPAIDPAASDDDVNMSQESDAAVVMPENLQLQDIELIEQTLREIIETYLNAEYTIVSLPVAAFLSTSC